jgi:hypothetical protein
MILLLCLRTARVVCIYTLAVLALFNLLFKKCFFETINNKTIVFISLVDVYLCIIISDGSFQNCDCKG